ncbi:MAG: SGNH hydrolase domain-containing protein, partial [Pseudomonadota bacterium]
PRIVATSLSCLVIASVAGLGLSSNADTLRPIPDHVAKLDAYKTYPQTTDGMQVTSADGCMLYDGFKGGFSGFNKLACLPPQRSTEAPAYLLIGDSHATHLMSALQDTLQGASLQRAAAAYCAPLLGTPGFAKDHDCSKLMRFLFQDHIPTANLDAVILSARWRNTQVDELQSTVSRLATITKRVIVLGPTVEYDGHFPQILARHSWQQGAAPEAFLRREPQVLDAQMRAIAWPDNVTYVSMIDLICATSGSSCAQTTKQGAPYHFDYAHYTFDAAREIASKLKMQVQSKPTHANSASHDAHQ